MHLILLMHKSKIHPQISSNLPEVLERTIAISTAQASIERQRAERAENRAAALFAATGVATGLLAHFGSTVLTSEAKDPRVVTMVLSASLFLMKAAYAALRTSWTLKVGELTPEFPLLLEQMSLTESLRKELQWRVWECRELQAMSMRRLFSLNRAQRNFVAGSVSFAGAVTLDTLGVWLKVDVPTSALIVLALLLGVTVLLLDVAAEKCGTFWRSQPEPPRAAENFTEEISSVDQNRANGGHTSLP